MPSSINEYFRLFWPSGDGDIPLGFIRDHQFDDRAFQGAVSGQSENVDGGGEHNHSLAEHTHVGVPHSHSFYGTSSSPLGVQLAKSYSVPTEAIGPTYTHSHISSPVSNTTITYGLSDPGNTEYTSGIITQHVTVIAIQPLSQLIYIPCGCIIFTDQPNQPDGFYIANGISGTLDLNNLFVIGATSGQNGGIINDVPPSGHTHITSGIHYHASYNHDHPSKKCGSATSFNSKIGIVSNNIATTNHHDITPLSTGTNDTDVISIVTDASVSGLEPAYIKLLGLQSANDNAVPKDIIIAFVGELDELNTDEWQICDGSYGTLDLRGFQIKVTTETSEIGNSDGSSNFHTHTSYHNHNISGTHYHNIFAVVDSVYVNLEKNVPFQSTFANGSVHTHTWQCSSTSMSITGVDLTTTSGDHRGPWRTVHWVKSKLNPPVFNDISLYTIGYDNISGAIPLIVSGDIGYQSFSDEISLYSLGHDLLSNSVSLYTRGHNLNNNACNLFINGYLQKSEDINLFINGYSELYKSTTLYINGHDNVVNDIPLFINGYIFESNDIDLFINGHDSFNNFISLYINSHSLESQHINLFIDGHSDFSENIFLYTNGYDNITDNVPLFVGGYLETFNDINLYIYGYDCINRNCELFIGGTETVSGFINLFVNGFSGESGYVPLVNTGHELYNDNIPLIISGYYLSITNNINLFIRGSGIEFITNHVPLIINGLFQKPVPICPIRDPSASIQISQNIVDIYQSRMDAIINQIGKNIILEFNSQTRDCPVCSLDLIRNRGIYFHNKCPHCLGTGLLKTPSILCIKCMVDWNPRDSSKYGISIINDTEIIKLKTLIIYADKLRKAKCITVDRNGVKFKAKRVKGPYPIGLQEDRYCVSFWRTL